MSDKSRIETYHVVAGITFTSIDDALVFSEHLDNFLERTPGIPDAQTPREESMQERVAALAIIETLHRALDEIGGLADSLDTAPYWKVWQQALDKGIISEMLIDEHPAPKKKIIKKKITRTPNA